MLLCLHPGTPRVISLVFWELNHEVTKTGSQDAGYHNFIPENSSHVDNMLPWYNVEDPSFGSYINELPPDNTLDIMGVLGFQVNSCVNCALREGQNFPLAPHRNLTPNSYSLVGIQVSSDPGKVLLLSQLS